MDRNYSSIYDIKQTAIDVLAPKYFNMDEVNDLNIGLLGYVTEMIGDVTEDTFNTVSSLMNEMFVNTAILPETIYSYASLFQINDVFATPSELGMVIGVAEDDITRYASRVMNDDGTYSNVYEFFIDSDMIIDIEGIQFSPDYDIRVSFTEYRGDYIFNAMYHMNRYDAVYKNGLSNITSPYITIQRTNIEGRKYLMLLVQTHQITRRTIEESIVNNSIINYPTFEIEFDGSLANMEIFYKESGSPTAIQLEKRLDGSTPVKTPFCYYKFKSDTIVEISFSIRDGYFQPDYNSTLYIDYMITDGVKGNFGAYSGSLITISLTSTKYSYNSALTVVGYPYTGASGGTDRMDTENLRNDVIEKFSTLGSYATENDLRLFFNSMNSKFGTNIVFIKKRDDFFERLFTSFTMIKSSIGDVFHTNTMNMDINIPEFDIEYTQSDAYILKPGHLFVYDETQDNVVKMLPNSHIGEEIPSGYNFVYTNPFLIYFGKSPSVVGYYMTNINAKYPVEYTDVNNTSIIQFICNGVRISRDSINGDNSYTLKVVVMPTSELTNKIVEKDNDEYIFRECLVIRLNIRDGENSVGFIDMSLTDWDLDSNIYTYSCEITTDDYITINNKFRILNVYNIDESNTYPVNPILIPMTECGIDLYTYYNYSEELPVHNSPIVYTTTNPPVDLIDFTHTNTYSSNTVQFIEPLTMIRGTASYIYTGTPGEGEMNDDNYKINISMVPLVSAYSMSDNILSDNFYTALKDQYDYLNKVTAINTLITNSYSIDIKFYNTYGNSIWFSAGDDDTTLLDRVNIRIRFKVKPAYGINTNDLTRDIKIFIKDYIENIDDSGSNSFYVSNLITELENKFDGIKYLQFININDMASTVQVIENNSISDLTSLSKEKRMVYVPEYLTISLDDIIIDII